MNKIVESSRVAHQRFTVSHMFSSELFGLYPPPSKTRKTQDLVIMTYYILDPQRSSVNSGKAKAFVESRLKANADFTDGERTAILEGHLFQFHSQRNQNILSDAMFESLDNYFQRADEEVASIWAPAQLDLVKEEPAIVEDVVASGEAEVGYEAEKESFADEKDEADASEKKISFVREKSPPASDVSVEKNSSENPPTATDENLSSNPTTPVAPTYAFSSNSSVMPRMQQPSSVPLTPLFVTNSFASTTPTDDNPTPSGASLGDNPSDFPMDHAGLLNPLPMTTHVATAMHVNQNTPFFPTTTGVMGQDYGLYETGVTPNGMSTFPPYPHS